MSIASAASTGDIPTSLTIEITTSTTRASSTTTTALPKVLRTGLQLLQQSF
jgi:hypothetical protein